MRKWIVAAAGVVILVAAAAFYVAMRVKTADLTVCQGDSRQGCGSAHWVAAKPIPPRG